MKQSHLTLRLPADLARALERWARRRGVPKSLVVREAVARLLSPGSVPAAAGLTAGELAARWRALPRLGADDAAAFAADVAAARDALPPVVTPWE